MDNNAKQGKAPVSSTGGPNPRQTASTAPRKHVNRVLCRTTDYQPPGSRNVGLSSNNQPSKVVWELDYGLTEVQFKQLSARFPGVAFVQTGFDCHDHPIAHTSYRVVWENVFRSLKPGQKVAEISGNPDYNARHNARQAGRREPIIVDTFCKVMTPKDSIRAKTRWGPQVKDGVRRWEEMTMYDMYRNDENRARFAQYDVFLLNHALYYYRMEEVNQLLQLNPAATMVATIHKLNGQNGTINCGEQSFVKDLQSGTVVQTNVETGEEYKHPDPAPWFKKFCYADEHGAFAWTINKGCDDTYKITATSTDPRLVPEDCWRNGRIVFTNRDGERLEATVQEVADPPPAYTVERVVIKTHDLVPGLKVAPKEKVVDITHPELFQALKSFMINKPRNARTLQDLTAKAHREAGNNTLLGNNQRVKISPEALTLHIFAAWKEGLELESSLFSSITSANGSIAAVNRNLSGRSITVGPSNALKQGVRVALGINTIMRSKDSINAVLQHVDDLL